MKKRERIGSRAAVACVLAVPIFAAGPVLAQATSDDGFAAFLAALEAAGRTVRDNTPEGDGPERAEGYRHLIRLVEFAQASFLDDADPAHPNVLRCPSKACKIGFDSPDQVYVGIRPISSEYVYRVFGKRGTVDYMAFQVFDNPYGGPSALDADDLRVSPDGSWELFLSSDPRPGNWLPTTPTSTQLVIRLTFADWDEEVEGSVQVEVLGPTGAAPVPPLTPTELAARARSLAATIEATPALFQQLRAAYPSNDFVEPAQDAFGLANAGLADNLVSPAQYEIGTDEALLVESPAIPVRFRNVQLGNRWLESLDYASRQTSLNEHQSYLDRDGVYRFVLAHTDPGVPNWLDVAGHPSGTIFMRWNRPLGGVAPKPVASVVPLAELHRFLPADHPIVSPSERADILQRRRQAYNRRTNPAGLALGESDDRGRGPGRLPRKRLP